MGKMEEEKVEKPKMDEEKVEASLIGEEKVETLKVEEEKAEKMDEEKVEPTKMEEESTEKEGDKVDTPKNDDKVVELENKPSDTKMEEESKSKTEELAAASNNDSKEDATLNGGDTEASPSRRMYKNLDDYLVSPGESSNITKGKRTRRTVERHDPSLYARSTPEKSSPLFMDGRGTKLNDIESVQNSIQSRNDQLLRTAYKFLFTARGKQVKLSLNQIKQSLLNYSGYLAKDATEKADLTVETKYSVRAHKLTTKNLKDLCDLFYIDRSVQDGVPVGKDELVERLLNFLSAPDEKLVKKKKILKRKKNKDSPGKKKRRKVEVNTELEDTDGDESMEDNDMNVADAPKNETTNGEEPTDDELRKWVEAYITCFNLDKATTTHAVQTASDKFGFDLKHKKSLIKNLLAEAMS